MLHNSCTDPCLFRPWPKGGWYPGGRKARPNLECWLGCAFGESHCCCVTGGRRVLPGFVTGKPARIKTESDKVYRPSSKLNCTSNLDTKWLCTLRPSLSEVMNGVVVVRERQRQPWVSLEALTQWWVVSGLKGRHAQSLGLGWDVQTTKTARNTRDPERKNCNLWKSNCAKEQRKIRKALGFHTGLDLVVGNVRVERKSRPNLGLALLCNAIKH